MSIHVVIHSYRHGLNAESSRSCEPFLTCMLKGRLSTEAHSVVLKRVNLYEFLGYQVVTAWMPASISVTVVRNSAADNFICCYLWWCYEDVEYLSLKAFTLMGIIAGSRSTDTPFWLPEQGALKHYNTPWHAVACLDPCWSFCIAIKIIFIFHHNEQDGLLHSLRHVHLLLFLTMLWSSFLVREGLRQWKPSEK